MEQVPTAAARRKTWALLLLILIAGFSLRSWYGSWYLHQNRFWDEQYALKNVHAFLLTGDVKPVNGYYPSPVWSVPQATVLRISEALYSRTGNEAYRVLNNRQRLNSTGILLCRWMQAIYGTLALLFVFLAGRRMFGVPVALLATAMVAFARWPIHSSGVIKPDALLLWTITMSFWACVAAVDKPTVWRHVVAGVAIALAMSSKLTGGLIAVPLVVATLVLGWRERRRIVLLMVSGVTSAVVFVVLNPYWMHYLFLLEGLKRDYAFRARLSGVTRLSIPTQVIDLITGVALHGLVVGVASLVGFALLVASVVRRGADGAGSVAEATERAKRAMFVVFPLVYTLVYTVQTPYFKPNNFQPLVLFTSLSAAWLLVHCRRLAMAWWPPLERQAATVAMLATFALWVVIPGWNFTYRALTPTTRDLAVRFIDKQLGAPKSARLVHVETWAEPDPPWEGRKSWPFHRGLSAIQASRSLDQVPAVELDSSDGIVFLEDRLEGDGAAFYRQRQVSGPGPQVQVFRAELFEARGPGAVAIAHPWILREPYRDLDPRRCVGSTGGCLTLDLPPDLAANEVVSLFARLPVGDSESSNFEPPRITIGDRTLQLSVASWQRKGWLYVSPRFSIGGAGGQVRLTREAEFDDLDDDVMLIQVARWSAPESGIDG